MFRKVLMLIHPLVRVVHLQCISDWTQCTY